MDIGSICIMKAKRKVTKKGCAKLRKVYDTPFMQSLGSELELEKLKSCTNCILCSMEL